MLVLVLLITKPFEFKAKLIGRFSPDKTTTVQFENLLYAIPELNTEYFTITNNLPKGYIHQDKKSIYKGNSCILQTILVTFI